jgi:arylsulfatase A
LISALERTGQRDNTLVLFTTDNGTDYRIHSDMGASSVQGGKTYMTDAGAAVPMVASWPGVVPAGERCGDLIDFTDILPTLADVAEASRPEAASDGRSFAPQMRGEQGDPRDWVFVQLHKKWFLRNHTHQLHEDGTLVDVRDRFAPLEVADDSVAESMMRHANELLGTR